MNLHADLGDLASWTTEELLAAQAVLDGELEKAAPLTPSDWADKMNALYGRTADLIDGYAGKLANGRITPLMFRSQMTSTLRTAWTNAYRAGASSAFGRSPLTPEDYAAVARLWGDQLQYLENFARQAKTNDWNEAYLKWRANLYANGLHRAFWTGRNSRYADEEWQVEYLNHDFDPCGPCRYNAAAGPYTPSQAPIPGENCEGMNNCRCTLHYTHVASAIAAEEPAVEPAPEREPALAAA